MIFSRSPIVVLRVIFFFHKHMLLYRLRIANVCVRGNFNGRVSIQTFVFIRAFPISCWTPTRRNYSLVHITWYDGRVPLESIPAGELLGIANCVCDFTNYWTDWHRLTCTRSTYNRVRYAHAQSTPESNIFKGSRRDKYLNKHERHCDWVVVRSTE